MGISSRFSPLKIFKYEAESTLLWFWLVSFDDPCCCDCCCLLRFFDFISSLSLLFLHFILLFWNQIFTWESFSDSLAANFFRSGLLMYFCLTNAASRPRLWLSENTALLSTPRRCFGFIPGHNIGFNPKYPPFVCPISPFDWFCPFITNKRL